MGYGPGWSRNNGAKQMTTKQYTIEFKPDYTDSPYKVQLNAYLVHSFATRTEAEASCAQWNADAVTFAANAPRTRKQARAYFIERWGNVKVSEMSHLQCAMYRAVMRSVEAMEAIA